MQPTWRREVPCVCSGPSQPVHAVGAGAHPGATRKQDPPWGGGLGVIQRLHVLRLQVVDAERPAARGLQRLLPPRLRQGVYRHEHSSATTRMQGRAGVMPL